MVSPINNNLTGLVFEATNNRAALEDSISKLSSGKRINRVGVDTGAHSQVTRLGSKNVRDIATIQNLQNSLSYSQTQDGVLQSVGDILTRMGEIAVRALDITANDDDRENHNKEFLELADQLDKYSNEDFNGLDLFGAGAFSDEKNSFIEALQKQWLKGAMNVIEQRFGLTPEGSDSFKVIVNENDTGGHTAFVAFAGQDVIEMQFDLPDFQSPYTTPSTDSPIFRADRVVAHEMTHAVMADALDLTTSVDGTSSGGAANWFIEGTAEFIHGADYRVVADLGGVIGLDANQSGGNDIAFNDGAAQTAKVTSNGASIINAIGSGTEGWSASPQYSAGYIATRYLHDQLKNNGGGAAPDGIKTMLVWMEANNESVGGALKHFLAGHDAGNYGAGVSNKQAHDNFIAEFKGGAGLTFLQNMDLTNTDTGAITGADADGGATITATEAVPNTGAGFAPDSTAQTQPLATTQGGANGFTLTWEEDSGSLEVTRDGSGETYEMKSVFNSKISDTETYNLKSITSAKATLSELEDLLTKLSSNRATVGANVTRLQNELQGLAGKITQGEMAVSRIEDADIAQESSNYASTQVRTQASIAILAQAKQLNVGVSDLLRGVNIGG